MTAVIALSRGVVFAEDGDDAHRAGRLGVEHHGSGVHVAEVDHLAGAVGVGGPEVVELDAAAVDVFPAAW